MPGTVSTNDAAGESEGSEGTGADWSTTEPGEGVNSGSTQLDITQSIAAGPTASGKYTRLLFSKLPGTVKPSAVTISPTEPGTSLDDEYEVCVGPVGPVGLPPIDQLSPPLSVEVSGPSS